MNKLILIAGDLASGKSTIAEYLSKKHAIPTLIKDDMKEINCDVVGFSTREENLKLSLAAVQEMIYAFRKFIVSKTDIILEANFRKEELDQILKIAMNDKYEVFAFVFEGDIDILYKRFLDRLPSRNKAHTTLHLEESFEKFKNHILDFRKNTLDIPYTKIVIDNHTIESLAEQIEKSVF